MGFLEVQVNPMPLRSQKRKRKFSAVYQLEDLINQEPHQGGLHDNYELSDRSPQYWTPCESQRQPKWHTRASHFDNFKNQQLDADKVTFSYLLLLL